MGELAQRGAAARRAQRRLRRRRARRVDDVATRCRARSASPARSPPASRSPPPPRPTSSGSRSSSAATTRRSSSTTPTRRPSPTSSSTARSPTAARSARRSSGSTCPRRCTTRWSRRSPRRPRRPRSATAWTAGTELGPINNPPQYERVERARRRRRRRRGAAVAAGGAPIDGPGYFFQPTILAGVADGTRIVDEEQFGPALPVIPLPRPRRRHRAGQRHALRPVGLGVERATPTAAAEVADAARVRHRLGQRPPGARARTSRSAASSGAASASRTARGASPASPRSRCCTAPRSERACRIPRPMSNRWWSPSWAAPYAPSRELFARPRRCRSRRGPTGPRPVHPARRHLPRCRCEFGERGRRILLVVAKFARGVVIEGVDCGRSSVSTRPTRSP